MWIRNNHKEINMSDPRAAGHTLAITGDLKTDVLWNIYLLWLQRVSKHSKHCVSKRWASSEAVGVTVESGTTNESDLNKPLASFPIVTSGDKGPLHLTVTPRAWLFAWGTIPSLSCFWNPGVMNGLFTPCIPEGGGTINVIYSRPRHLKLQQPEPERGRIRTKNNNNSETFVLQFQVWAQKNPQAGQPVSSLRSSLFSVSNFRLLIKARTV